MSETLDRITDWLEENRKAAIGVGSALVACLVLGGGAYWWFEARWRPPPSIFDAPVDDVLGYLAMDDFSSLSLEERVRYLQEFASRFQGMQQEESAAAAAFLAGVTGPTRERLRENARTLAKDVLLDGAEGYFATPEADRAAYLDDWLANWQRRAEEAIRGDEARELGNEERAAEIRADAQRDLERDRDPGDLPPLDTRATARFLGFWQSDIESASTPREQGQIIRFMEDLRGHLVVPRP